MRGVRLTARAIVVFRAARIWAASRGKALLSSCCCAIPSSIESLRAAIGTPAVVILDHRAAARFVTIIPSNVVVAALSAAMLPLVVCALLFGFACARSIETPGAGFVLFQILADTIYHYRCWVLWAALLAFSRSLSASA
jgi:Na+/H+-dicarboxylate symporter